MADGQQTSKIPDNPPTVVRTVVDVDIQTGELTWYMAQGSHPVVVVGALMMAAIRIAMEPKKKSFLSL